MADTINQNILLYDESGNKFYPKTNAASIITTNTGTNGAYLNQQEFNDSINTKLTSEATLCQINGTAIKYGVNNTLAVGTGGNEGSSGVTLGEGLSDLNNKLSKPSGAGYLYYSGSGYSWTSISTTGSTTGSTTLSTLTISDNNDHSLSYQGNAQKYLKFGGGIQGALSTTTNTNDTLTISTVAGSFKGFQYFQTSSATQYNTWNMGTDGYYMLQGGTGIELQVKDNKLTITATGSNTGTGGSTGSTSGITSDNLLSTLQDKLEGRKIWGQDFTKLFNDSNINGNIYMQGVDSNGSIDISIYMDGTSGTTQVFKRHDNELIIGSGLANTTNSSTCIATQTTSIKTYKADDETYDYTFTAANFDIGTNNIRLGTAETDEALIYWDTENHCVRIRGSLCADGGITAFGVNSASTSTSEFHFGDIYTSNIYLRGSIVRGAYSLYDYTNEKLTLQRSNANDTTRAICKLELTTSNDTGCSIYTDANVDSTTTSDTKNNLAIYAGSKGTLYLGDMSQTNQKGINITDTGVVTLCVGQDGDYLNINQNGTNYKFNVEKAKGLGILTEQSTN